MTLDEAVTATEKMIASYKRSVDAMETLLKAFKDNTQEAAPKEAYTFTKVRGIMAGLSSSGRKAEAKALLTKFGAARLSDVKEADYAALVQEARRISDS